MLNAIPALRVGRRLGIPVVYEVRAFWEDAAVDHGTAPRRRPALPLTRALETCALQARRRGHHDLRRSARRTSSRAASPPDKVTVIPNAVDIEAFSRGRRARPGAASAKLGLDGALVLGFIGSFYAYEGLDVLLRALPQLLAQRANVRVLLVGGGPQEAELKQLAAELGIADNVVFAGRVPHDEVQRYYDLIDVLVYPRLSMRLTELVTPLKPLEAMAQGRLLVASDVGGHRELIRHGETGMLFKAGDPRRARCRGAGPVRRPEPLAGAARRPARRFVETERNWKASVARYDGVYRRVLDPS